MKSLTLERVGHEIFMFFRPLIMMTISGTSNQHQQPSGMDSGEGLSVYVDQGHGSDKEAPFKMKTKLNEDRDYDLYVQRRGYTNRNLAR